MRRCTVCPAMGHNTRSKRRAPNIPELLRKRPSCPHPARFPSEIFPFPTLADSRTPRLRTTRPSGRQRGTWPCPRSVLEREAETPDRRLVQGRARRRRGVRGRGGGDIYIKARQSHNGTIRTVVESNHLLNFSIPPIFSDEWAFMTRYRVGSY